MEWGRRFVRLQVQHHQLGERRNAGRQTLRSRRLCRQVEARRAWAAQHTGRWNRPCGTGCTARSRVLTFTSPAKARAARPDNWLLPMTEPLQRGQIPLIPDGTGSRQLVLPERKILQFGPGCRSPAESRRSAGWNRDRHSWHPARLPIAAGIDLLQLVVAERVSHFRLARLPIDGGIGPEIWFR